MAILLDIADDQPEHWIPEVEGALPGHEVIWAPEAMKTGRDLSDVEWAIVWAPDGNTLARLPGLKAIFSMGAGVDHVLRLRDIPAGVPIVRFVDPDLTNRMSEWIVLQCLMHLRQQRRYDRQQAAVIWNPLAQPIASEVTVGILGLGVLGTDASRKLSNIGFQVVGCGRRRKEIDGIDCYASDTELETFLSKTDILVSLLPHTPQTEGMIDGGFFRQLRRSGPLGGPVYINAGRGKTHRQADVVAALRDGTLKGASLDVFETEPLPRESELWAMDNVIITPHVAAWSSRKAVAAHAARQIARHRKGLPFENVADRQSGY